MSSKLKLKFRLYQRGSNGYYIENNETGQQESLHTKDRTEAIRLWNAKNETNFLAGSNLQVSRAYMVASDPHMPERDWQEVVDFIIDQKSGPNKLRWESFSKDRALKRLWKLPVVETRADQLLTMLKKGTVSTNVYLRRLHNFAFDMNWLPWPILAKKLWPKIKYGEKRGITREEHEKIIARETNPERRNYYEVLWYTGGSQTDVANLHAEDINWTDRTIFYRRKKSSSDAMPRFGGKLAAVLGRLPKSGPLFPYLITVQEKDRSTEFKQRCNGLGIKGITLHCYRYGWAERAAQVGYPERHAQSNLGHGSKAVARAYAKKAKVKTPPLEEYEEAKGRDAANVIPFPADIDVEGERISKQLAPPPKKRQRIRIILPVSHPHKVPATAS